MSDSLDLDLEKLLLPAWAKQSPDTNRYAKFEGGGDDRPERSRDGRRPGGDRRGPPRRDFGGSGAGGGGPRRDGPGGPRREGGRRDDRSGDRGGERREEPRREAPQLPQINIALTPDEMGAESLARQVRLTGRAYPLFDIAGLVLKKPERYQVTFSVVKKPDGTATQPLFLCSLDDTLWLSESEAAAHLLGKHFNTFYQTERIAGDAPKGTYTFVAQCGISGTLLGPPNYHDYQNKLRKLHAERFGRMPFEEFKSRVKIVKDEAIVKQWLEEASFKTVFTALNVPESVKFNTREEVEKHLRETHLPTLVKPVEKHALSGAAAQGTLSPGLRALARREWEDQSRFPLKLVTALSQQFASYGLQFFKRDKSVTYVSVARPHFLDVAATPVSGSIQRIVDFINATPKCSRRRILDALAPAPKPAVPATPDAPAAEPTITPEQQAVNADLHWLAHQGHVIEFANGLIEMAKRPLPRPEKAPRPVVAKIETAPKIETPVAAAPVAIEAPIAPAAEASSPTV